VKVSVRSGSAERVPAVGVSVPLGYPRSQQVVAGNDRGVAGGGVEKLAAAAGRVIPCTRASTAASGADRAAITSSRVRITAVALTPVVPFTSTCSSSAPRMQPEIIRRRCRDICNPPAAFREMVGDNFHCAAFHQRTLT